MLEYTAVDAAGATVRGKLVSAGELELDRELERRGLVLREARTVDERSVARRHGLKSDQLIGFTTQLSTLVSSGVPLIEGLSGIGRRMEGEAARATVEELVSEIESGEPFSRALEKHAGTFPPIYRASVKAGELTGALDVVLLRLARHLEWARSVQAAVVQALIYPSIVCAAVLGLIVVLLTFVLPRIVQLFPGGRGSMPLPTRIVLAASDFLCANGVVLALAAAAAVVGTVWGLRQPAGRALLHRVLLKVPRLGALLRKIATSRFASTAAVLHGAGCDVLTTLDTAASTCGNAVLEQSFARAVANVRRGATIAESLELEPEVDPMLKQLVAVGEKTGKLDDCLQRLVAHYDEDIPRSVKATLALLEPALLVGAGLVVGFIVFAAVTPIFKMYENL